MEKYTPACLVISVPQDPALSYSSYGRRSYLLDGYKTMWLSSQFDELQFDRLSIKSSSEFQLIQDFMFFLFYKFLVG